MSARRRKKKAAQNGKKVKKKVVAGEEKTREAPAEPDLEALIKKGEERDEYLERLQRTSADYANYQKRVQREMEETRKHAAGPVALDLLGVVDNMHRAIEAAVGKLDDDFIDGFRMIEQQLLDVLKRHGVKPIEAVDQPFDPNIHDALLEVEDASLPDRTVVDELEKGYMLHERLLRPTRVRVSRQPRKEDEKSESKDGASLEHAADTQEEE
jgi:molecular chaperone GrpE